ncbi:superoxide dismutase [Paenibacillus sambharensis]|uniref:superoxide dismutase n=1 Tax=Paenibacillus sambharensis TaxID=1803190 RepID=A0A2W1L9N5_9BACL|nr:Fe-Mn family superoxide dismutase [Paenibacillus sambharensis]PZD95613.1 superoxide dismutase [Paenibacillus sambharensis]
MLFVYGPYMPLRWLEEVRSWKQQEQQYAAVIKQLVPNLEPEYARVLEQWCPVFESTERCAAMWIHHWQQDPARLPVTAETQVEALLQAAQAQSEAFIRQLQHIHENSAALSANPAAPALTGHVIQQSRSFLQTLEATGLSGAASDPAYAAAGDTLDKNTRTPEEAPEEPEDHARLSGGGSKSVPVGGHTLPPLPYAYNAFEPYIDEATMRVHHSKHHQSYVDGLNKAEKMLQDARRTGKFELVKHWERELAFNGAGHYLHTIFWFTMKPGGSKDPDGPLGEAIKRDFGSMQAFKKHFSEAAEKVEGGGWTILVWSPRSSRLEILQAEKHQNLSQWDVIPLLPLDVWEHAYYLKHQNRRADYIKNWWNVVNWPHVEERFRAASTIRWTPY